MMDQNDQNFIDKFIKSSQDMCQKKIDLFILIVKAENLIQLFYSQICMKHI